MLNPHYKGMGGLYGSEYWTYTLPRRVGTRVAMALMDGMTAISARHARDLGMVDELVEGPATGFDAAVAQRAEALAYHRDFKRLLAAKWERRRRDEQHKPLAAYRAEELARMSENFFGPDRAYHDARRRFVLKRADGVVGSRGDEPALSGIRVRRALLAARWSGVSASRESAS